MTALQKIREISGQNVHRCMQCGCCSGSCPMFATGEMPVGPRRVMHLLQLGLTDRVAELNTAWLCAACHSCQARCPRSIDLPKVMEAVRLLTLRKNEPRVAQARVAAVAAAGAPPIVMVSTFRKFTA